MDPLPDDAFGPGGAVRVVGHRGAAGAAPENTLPALEHAVTAGADAVEVDVQATRDGELVLLHDDTVDRTTDGAGPVDAMTLEEVRELDAGHAWTPDRGATFPFRGEGVRVPTLEEALDAAGELPMVVEAKSDAGGEALAAWLEAAAPDRRRRVLVGGPGLGDPDSSPAAREAAERARWRCASQDELRPYVLLGKIGLGGRFAPDADALMVPERHRLLKIVTGRFVRQAHRDGLGVHVWTVNAAGRMRRLLDLGVDGLVTDLPGRARRVLDEQEVWS